MLNNYRVALLKVNSYFVMKDNQGVNTKWLENSDFY